MDFINRKYLLRVIIGTTIVMLMMANGAGATPVSDLESRYVWDAALGANLTYKWTPMNFDGFYYNRDDNLGKESLVVRLDNYLDRTIDAGKLIYTTTLEEVNFSYFGFGSYQVIGFMTDKYFAGYIANATDKPGPSANFSDKSTLAQGQLHNVLIDDDTQRTVSVGGTLTLQEGYVLKATDINTTARTMLLTLLKDESEVDSTSLSAGETYVYSKKTGNVADLPLIMVRFDNVFSGREVQAAFLRGLFQVSENYTSVKTGDKFGIMNVTNISGAGISMNNTDPISLSGDSTIDIMGKMKFKVADSDILRFYPMINYNSIQYERRGAVSSGSNNIATWDALNFAGFWYDLNNGTYSESLKVTNLTGRTIPEVNLNYTTTRIVVPYTVTQMTSKIPNGTDGTYSAIGWVGDKYTAIKGKTNKLSKIILEKGASPSEKKTLMVGEAWVMGDGYVITALSIDAKAPPRKARLLLGKNGVELDEKVVEQGGVYTYNKTTFGNETEVPIFITYIDSVFAGATSDMIQLRYTWLISEDVIEINPGDRFGIFNVTDVAGDSIILKNENPLELIAGSKITLIDTLNLTVADAPDLRYYPSKLFIQPLPPGYMSVSINDGIKSTNSTKVILTLVAEGATEISFRNESNGWTPWEPFATTKSWTLNSGDGRKTVYFKVRNIDGESGPVGSSIILDTERSIVTNISLSTSTPEINKPLDITAAVGDININTRGIFVSIKSPKGFVATSQMTALDSGLYTYHFTNTSEYGRYNVTIIARDLAGNVNDTEKTWFVTTMPPYTNQSINTTANSVAEIDAREKADTTLELVTSNGTSGGAINITISNDIPPQINRTFGLNPLGKYIEINASENIRQNISWIKLKFYYTKAELDASGLDENTLKISWYNESASPHQWETLDTATHWWVHGTGVNTLDISGYAGFIWANISHLSTFAIVGNSAVAVQPDGNSGSGSSSGSSGGGGGGGASDENYSNIEIREKYYQHILKDKVTSYKFTNKSNPILFINITGNTSAGDTAALVEVLRGTSSLLNMPAPGAVYKNVNIWVGTSGFAVPRNLKEAIIRFKIENSWIVQINIADGDIKLVRWDGKKWTQLETAEKAKDSTYTYYEAKTDAFSPFAITGLKETVTAPSVTIIQSDKPVINEKAIPEMEIKPAVNWVLIIGLFVVITAAVVLYSRRNSLFKK